MDIDDMKTNVSELLKGIDRLILVLS